MKPTKHNVIRLIDASGMPLFRFAAAIGVRPGTLYSYKYGRRCHMSALFAERIADRLGIDSRWLIRNDPLEPVPAFSVPGPLLDEFAVAENVMRMLKPFDRRAKSRMIAWLGATVKKESASEISNADHNQITKLKT